MFIFFIQYPVWMLYLLPLSALLCWFNTSATADWGKLGGPGSRYLVKGLVKLFSPSSITSPATAWNDPRRRHRVLDMDGYGLPYHAIPCHTMPYPVIQDDDMKSLGNRLETLRLQIDCCLKHRGFYPRFRTSWARGTWCWAASVSEPTC